ncbi:Arsenical pump ATPase [Parasponia andersonii]|uniref:Arsenical pump ATPase n=1 Tax=Parasponia andersonii TaxID=3476 RepID=A0A2P5CZZ8_PARAD|nr:Arsenical pump ATPase [Parasponia andersonii]
MRTSTELGALILRHTNLIASLLNKAIIKVQTLPLFLYQPVKDVIFVSSLTLNSLPPAVRRRRRRRIAFQAEEHGGFEEMASVSHRKIYFVTGLPGDGKTTLAASLAVKFATHGHQILLVSCDQNRSLSRTFAQDLFVDDFVRVDGVHSPLYASEVECASLYYGSLIDPSVRKMLIVIYFVLSN